MLCLIGSHELLHIIHAEARFPEDGEPMTQKYDNLVKGWILSTLNDQVRHKFRLYRSVQLLWRRLGSTFTYDDASKETEDLKYMQASNVNVSEFVSVKLSGRSNYKIWKAQMLRLMESHDMLHFVYSNRHLEDKYVKLFMGWIFGTLNEELLKDFNSSFMVRSTFIWEELENRFTSGDLCYEPVVSAIREDLKYMQASNVNISNFVSVKLSGCSNYHIWKTQMLCLIESQNLLHVINKKSHFISEKHDKLVKGWILSTMNEQRLLSIVDISSDHYSAKAIWRDIEYTFDQLKSDSDSDREDPLGVTFGTEFVSVPEIQDTDNTRLKTELYEATVEGCWWKAKSILKDNKVAATEAITANGNRMLHVAVEMGHNYFVEKLLEFLEDAKDIDTQNEKGRTALHIAAKVGNTHAAQLLVQKRKQLLEFKDHNNLLPLHFASTNTDLNTCAYLIKFAPPDSNIYLSYFDHKSALVAAIFSKQYDLAETLLKTSSSYNHCSISTTSAWDDVLMAMTISFPTDLGFIESFIYPSYHNVRQKTVLRGSLLFHPDRCVDEISRVVTICNNTCNNTCRRWLGKNSIILLVLIATLYSVYHLICLLILMLRLSFSMLYLLLWKVLAVTMHPIKNIEKKKKKYKEAKKILSLVCKLMGTSDFHYKDALFEAVRQDIYEVVDEILFWSPATIKCKDDEGYNIIQLSILNRAEKVYNLIYHIIERTKSHKDMKDSSANNLGHLVGRLAPSFVLGRTTGAALQLQRELLWFEEVKKLVLPLQLTEKNVYKETPKMVFTMEHQDLLKQGEMWMKTTAESCSITAALIVTVVFAAAITVPGGSNQESGIPLFKKEIAFTIFAVSNAFSLFTAATALLLFLSILTTRFSEKDFLVSLPRRLIFGLLTLFLSTTAMMVAFCAILFLVFCDQRPWMLAPICAFACLPISVIVTIKLPLLVDLIQSTYSPIFGKQRHLETCKVNRKSTTFTD